MHVVEYCILGIFHGMYISQLSMEPGLLWLKFVDEGYPNVFTFFGPSLLYTKNLYYYIKWDRQSSLPNSSYITVDEILDLPVAILQNTVVGQSKWAQWHHHALLKIMCRCMRWHIIHGQL